MSESFKEAVERANDAWQAAYGELLARRDNGEMSHAELNTQTSVAFLRSLEESGWKIVGPEPTERMLEGARDWSGRKYGKPIGNDAARSCWNAMRAFAPTITDLLTTKEPDER